MHSFLFLPFGVLSLRQRRANQPAQRPTLSHASQQRSISVCCLLRTFFPLIHPVGGRVNPSGRTDAGLLHAGLTSPVEICRAIVLIAPAWSKRCQISARARRCSIGSFQGRGHLRTQYAMRTLIAAITSTTIQRCLLSLQMLADVHVIKIGSQKLKQTSVFPHPFIVIR